MSGTISPKTLKAMELLRDKRLTAKQVAMRGGGEVTNTKRMKAICTRAEVSRTIVKYTNISAIREEEYTDALLEVSIDDGNALLDMRFPINDAPRIGDTFIIEVTPCK